MLISKSNLSLSASHELETHRLTEVKLTEMPSDGRSFEQLFKDQLQAPPARLLQPETPANTDAAADKPAEGAFQAIMEMLFGLPHVPDNPTAPDGGNAPLPARLRSVQRTELTHTSESESCVFAASGNICLADGSERQFAVGYRMDRSEESTTLSTTSGFKDPLAVELGAPTGKLGQTAVDFDLDGDGKNERVRLPGGDSAVLFFDRNHNGRADNGSELFGPQSGDGFAELAKLDSDGNGWIDSGDAAYADLKLWQRGADGTGNADKIHSLADAGIGALATANAETPFTLKENGAAVGQVRSSSVWLGETGGAGIVRQIDVSTEPAATQNVS